MTTPNDVAALVEELSAKVRRALEAVHGHRTSPERAAMAMQIEIRSALADLQAQLAERDARVGELSKVLTDATDSLEDLLSFALGQFSYESDGSGPMLAISAARAALSERGA